MKNKKIMSRVDVLVSLFFGFISLLMEIMIVQDKELPNDIKIFCSFIFGAIFLISSIVLIIDLIRRMKFDKNKLKTEIEEIVDYDVWYDVNDRTFYDKAIDEALGEKRTFLKRTDKYGNATLSQRDDNLFDWIFLILMSGMFLTVPIIQILKREKFLEVGNIICLFIGIILLIFSIKNINRIKKMNNKIPFFQYIKLLFMVSIFIFVFGGIIMIYLYQNTNLLKSIDMAQIIMTIFTITMIIGVIAFIYQMILVICAKIKKYKSITSENKNNEQNTEKL